MKFSFKSFLFLSVAGSMSVYGQMFDNWEQMDSRTEETIYALDMLGEDFGVAVGVNRTVLKWDGNAWGPMEGVIGTGFDSTAGLSAVSVISPSLVLIGGSTGSNNENVRGISVWDGREWGSKINGGPGENSVTGIWTDRSGLILTSRSYHTRVTRYEGENVASDIMNNTIWTLPYNAPHPSPSLFDIHGASSMAVFAAGTQGTVLRSIDEGINWVEVSTEEMKETHWYSVFAFSEEHVVVGGTKGQIAIWDGTNWTQETVLFGNLTEDQMIWNDIFAFAKDNIWVVGTYGAVKHFDGISWNDMELVYLPGKKRPNLRSICYDGNALWITGDGGMIYRARGN